MCEFFRIFPAEVEGGAMANFVPSRFGPLYFGVFLLECFFGNARQGQFTFLVDELLEFEHNIKSTSPQQ